MAVKTALLMLSGAASSASTLATAPPQYNFEVKIEV